MTEYALGIELAGSILKIAAFRKHGSSYKIASFSKLTISADFEKNREKLLQWKNSTIPKNKSISAVIAVPESALYLKEISLPKLSEKQVDEAAFWEVAPGAPFSKDDLICEWKRIDEQKDKTNVLAICARKSTIEKIVSTFEDIGISIYAVEPASLSFERVAQANFEPTTLLMTVEHEETNLLVMKNAVPAFTTSISTPLYAEKSGKRRLKKSIIKDLASQAYKTIAFWQEKNDEKILQAIITGDIAQKYYGLADGVNKKTKIPTLMATNRKLDNISFSTIAKAVRLRYLISIGAFYRLVKAKEKVNLLPKEHKQLVSKRIFTAKLKQAFLTLSVINVAATLLVLVALVSLSIWNKSLIKLASEKEVQVKNHEATPLVNEVNEINNLAIIVDNLMSRQKDTGVRLEFISQMTPQPVILTAIDFGQLESEEWKISGVGDREEILIYYDKLVADAGAKEVSMPYSNLANENDNEFEIKIVW